MNLEQVFHIRPSPTRTDKTIFNSRFPPKIGFAGDEKVDLVSVIDGLNLFLLHIPLA